MLTKFPELPRIDLDGDPFPDAADPFRRQAKPGEGAFTRLCPDARGPSFIVDADSFLLHYANEAGRVMLAWGYPLRAVDGHLLIGSDSMGRRLRQELRAGRESPGDIFVVSDGEAGPFAIRGHLAEGSFTPSPGSLSAVLHVIYGTIEPTRSELDAISQGFALTEAEKEVLGLVVAGHPLQRIARMRGVRFETVRRQCKTVLAKLRCHRQADLVRLVISLCSVGRTVQSY